VGQLALNDQGAAVPEASACLKKGHQRAAEVKKPPARPCLPHLVPKSDAKRSGFNENQKGLSELRVQESDRDAIHC